MAKLGMPNPQIAFQEAGVEAIERSQRGIVALLLEEVSTTIEKVGSLVRLYDVGDIPADLTDANKDYIIKTFKGYVTSPRRVIIALQAQTADEGTDADKFEPTLKTLETERWDWLAIPTIKAEQCEYVASWMKTQRENKHKRSKVVLPGYAADHEGVVNFSNTKIIVGEKTYTPAEYTPRIAGIICGTPMKIAATYAPVNEITDCDRHTIDENDEKVNKGEFFIWYDGEKFKMSRALNSLVTTTEGKLEKYQTIKTMETMDMIHDDIWKTTQDSYTGKYANDPDNKKLLITAILGYLSQLENERLLEKGKSFVDIDVEGVKAYVLSKGRYTKEQLSGMTEDEIKRLDTDKKVFLRGKINILDAMEDINLTFDI